MENPVTVKSICKKLADFIKTKWIKKLNEMEVRNAESADSRR